MEINKQLIFINPLNTSTSARLRLLSLICRRSICYRTVTITRQFPFKNDETKEFHSFFAQINLITLRLKS